MDVKLVGQALQYHGVDLRNSLISNEENSSHLYRKQPKDIEIKDEEFHKQLCAFIGSKADSLFKALSAEEKDKEIGDTVEDSYAIMPPMEIFMDVPGHLLKEHFILSLRSDDCVTGVVSAVLDNGIRIHLLCVDKGCSRDIEDLDIQAFCPMKELPKLYPNKSSLEAFQEKDIVRGIVLSVNLETERIIVSLLEKAVPDKSSYPKVGLITEGDFSVNYRRKKHINGMSYEEMLHSILGFNNQGNVRTLIGQLGINDNTSLMKCHSGSDIPENEYAEGLRKKQSQQLAHHSVTQGVEKLKAGQDVEAMQHFNHALQIDKGNVEALVARGALFANKENYPLAIQDLEKALSINPKHVNGRNYLKTILLTFGKICEDDNRLEEAVAHYSHAIKIDPANAKAIHLLAECRSILASQTSPGKSEKAGRRKLLVDADTEAKKGKQADTSIISKSADKLRQLIQEDKKEKRSRRKKRNRHSRPSRSVSAEKPKKKKRRMKSSSSSSSSSSSTSSTDAEKFRKISKKSRKESAGSDNGKKHQRQQRSTSSTKEKKKKHKISAEAPHIQAEPSTGTFLQDSLSGGSAACPILVSPINSKTDLRDKSVKDPPPLLLNQKNPGKSVKNGEVSEMDDSYKTGKEKCHRKSSEKVRRRSKSPELVSGSTSSSRPISGGRHGDADRSRSSSQTKTSTSKGEELAQKLLDELTTEEKRSAFEFICHYLAKDQTSATTKNQRSSSPENSSRRSQHASYSDNLRTQTSHADQEPTRKQSLPRESKKLLLGDDKFPNTDKQSESQESSGHGKPEKDETRHTKETQSSMPQQKSDGCDGISGMNDQSSLDSTLQNKTDGSTDQLGFGKFGPSSQKEQSEKASSTCEKLAKEKPGTTYQYKARMDHPSLNVPLLSSNDLAAIEREIKKRQQKKLEALDIDEKAQTSNVSPPSKDFSPKVIEEAEGCKILEGTPIKIKGSSQEKKEGNGKDYNELDKDSSKQSSHNKAMAILNKNLDRIGIENANQDSQSDCRGRESLLRMYKELLKHVQDPNELNKILQRRLLAEKINIQSTGHDVEDKSGTNTSKSVHVEGTVKQPMLNDTQVTGKAVSAVISPKADADQSNIVVMQHDGWSYDIHGNKYFATKGLTYTIGWHRDTTGNLFYASFDKNFDQLQKSDKSKDLVDEVASKGVAGGFKEVADEGVVDEFKEVADEGVVDERGHRHSSSRSSGSSSYRRSRSRSHSWRRKSYKSRSRSRSRQGALSRSRSRSYSRYRKSNRARSISRSRHRKLSRSKSRSRPRNLSRSRSRSRLRRSRSLSYSKYWKSTRLVSRQIRSRSLRRSRSPPRRRKRQDSQTSAWHRGRASRSRSRNQRTTSRSRSWSRGRRSLSRSRRKRSNTRDSFERGRRGDGAGKRPGYGNEVYSSKSRTRRSWSRNKRPWLKDSRERSIDTHLASTSAEKATESTSSSVRVSSKWDTFDDDNSSSQISGNTKGDTLKETPLLQGLPFMEKFLTDLKQKQRNQWIAEGKVKEKD